MKIFIRLFYIRSANGLLLAVWMVHIPHRSPVGVTLKPESFVGYNPTL